MSNNFKKTFFSNLLVVLIIISNLVSIKYTNFGGLVLSVNFITLPFVYLCFLLINNIANKKESWISLLSAVLVQIFVLLSYILITNLGSQNIIPDMARYINIVFKPDITNILINLISLIVSTFVLYYIYEYFRIVGYKLLGTVLSILSALILYGLLSIPITNYQFGFEIVLDMIMGHLLISTFMTILISIMFYLLKEREYPYNENKLFIKDINISVPKNKTDKSIEDVIKITNKSNEKSNKEKSNNSKDRKRNNSKKDNVKNNDGKKNVKK